MNKVEGIEKSRWVMLVVADYGSHRKQDLKVK